MRIQNCITKFQKENPETLRNVIDEFNILIMRRVEDQLREKLDSNQIEVVVEKILKCCEQLTDEEEAISCFNEM